MENTIHHHVDFEPVISESLMNRQKIDEKLKLLFQLKENERQQLLSEYEDKDNYAREYSVGIVNFGSKCDVGCFYCSQEFNPQDICPSAYDFLPVNKIKTYLKLVPNKKITEMGSTAWTWGGELFQHPKCLELLEYIKNEGYSINSMSTSGQNITEDHVKILKDIIVKGAPEGVDWGIGFHLCNYEKSKTALDLLDRYEVPYQIVIVPTRGFVKNGRIEKWIKNLQAHNPKFIGMQKPSYTKLTPERVVKQMNFSDKELLNHISKWKKEYAKVDIAYQSMIDDTAITTSLTNLIRFIKREHLTSYVGMHFSSSNEVENILEKSVIPKILFLTAESVSDVSGIEWIEDYEKRKARRVGVKGIFEKILEFKNQMNLLIDGHSILQDSKVVTVENITFGGNTTVSGLLCIDDYISAIDEVLSNGFDPDFIVMPSESFPLDNKDFKRVPVTNISKKYGIRTITV